MKSILITCLITTSVFATGCGGADARPVTSDEAAVSLAEQPQTTTTTSNEMKVEPQWSATPPNATTNSAPSNPPAAKKDAGAVVLDNPGAAHQTPMADNTKMNSRERHDTLTPTDQGNSARETGISAAIRRRVVGDRSFSFTAMNVKVIAIGSKVTLRGPVNSERESVAIALIAKQTPGVTEVDNQLEVRN